VASDSEMARSKPDWITSRVPRIPVELACSQWRCPLWKFHGRFPEIQA